MWNMCETNIMYQVKGTGTTHGYTRTSLKRMRENLVSEEGRLKYFMRQYIIEPIFGHLKFNVGYRNFLLRGLEKVRAEFKLMSIGWNLKKMLKLGIKPATV